MHSRILFLANEIKLLQSKKHFLFLIVSGIVLCMSGLIMILLHSEIRYLIVEKALFGLGFCTFSWGLLLLLNYYGLTLSINSSRGIIEIRNIYATKKIPVAFPISYFSRIVVFEQPMIPKKQKIRNTYSISLEHNLHTNLLLAEFIEKEKAFEFVHKLQELILLDIYFQNKLYKKSDFKLKASNIPEEINLPKTSKIKKLQRESEIVLRWRGYHNFLSFFFITGICYGCYYLLHFFFFQVFELTLESWLIYVTAGICALLSLFLYLATYGRTKTIHMDRESIQYYTNTLFIKSKKLQMNWDDVTLVRNTICASRIAIISKQGSELMDELMELTAKRQTPQLQNTITSKLGLFTAEQLILNVGVLPLSDRIRIEQEILNFML